MVIEHVFEPPAREEAPLSEGPLFSRYKLPRGVTLLKVNGVYTEVRYPIEADILSAERAYLGGRVYHITNEEVDELTAAGYGAHIYLAGVYDDVYGDGYFA